MYLNHHHIITVSLAYVVEISQLEQGTHASSALILLVGTQKEQHTAFKNRVTSCWHT